MVEESGPTHLAQDKQFDSAAKEWAVRYLNDWKGVLKSITPRQTPEGGLRELESFSDSEEFSDSDDLLGEDEFLLLQKMQLTMPPLQILEEHGEFDIELWPNEESLTPDELLNIQMVLGNQVQQAKIEGVNGWTS